jgi:Ala-tRNA(Pro) deacylase
MLESDLLNFHPLVNTATLSIRRDDFLKFLEAENHSPLIVRVSEPA